MNTQQSAESRFLDTAMLVVIAVIGTGAVGHWLAANLASLLAHRRRLHVTLPQSLAALGRLPGHWGNPRRAWPEPVASQLPGPVLYWFSVVVVVGLLIGLLGAVLTLRSRRHEPPDKRQRVGVAAQARLARAGDLRPLLTRRPEPGRFVVARWRRRYLSTEADSYRRRRGVRGAVIVFGPSQSGKTTGLRTGLEAWAGPAIVSSVKTDLMRATIAGRQRRGNVKVFDPVGISGMETATWTPLAASRDLRGALAAAQILARAGGDGPPNDRFWRGQAEQLIASMLWAAANTPDHTMGHVVRWVMEFDRPDGDRSGTLAPLVRLLTDNADPVVAASARKVQGWLHGHWATDPRTLASVYITARDALWPWADPDIEASARDCDITLDWLLGGNNTLYLCAPLGDETRIGLVFAVLMGDLIAQAFNRYNATGRSLDPRLLVLADEAANTPLPKLPEWASTVTGAGLQLVDVWQSKAQLDRLYGQHADTVLTNHRTQLIFPSGLSDSATTEYLANLLGSEHVRSDLDEPTWHGDDDVPTRSPGSAVPFLSANVLRQMRVGDALVIHGQLPPAWVRAPRYRRPRPK